MRATASLIAASKQGSIFYILPPKLPVMAWWGKITARGKNKRDKKERKERKKGRRITK